MHRHLDMPLHYTPSASVPGHASAKLSLKKAVFTPTSSPGHVTDLRSPYISTLARLCPALLPCIDALTRLC